MRIPTSVVLESIQASFRDVQLALRPIETGLISLRGGRIMDAGKPVNDFDYVRKFDMDAAITDLIEEIKDLKKRISKIEAQ